MLGCFSSPEEAKTAAKLDAADIRFDVNSIDVDNKKCCVSERVHVHSIFCNARFRLGQRVRDLLQDGKIVAIGQITCRDDPSKPDYRYHLGFSSVIRRERDLEPLREDDDQ